MSSAADNPEMLEALAASFTARAAQMRMYSGVVKEVSRQRRIKRLVDLNVGFIENTRKLNIAFLQAWAENRLDALWEQMRGSSKRGDDSFLHYFIRCRASGSFKIGRTNRIKMRFKALLTGSPRGLELVACYPSTDFHEAELHEQFAEGRLNGEWFELHGALLNYLRAIGSTVEVPA